MTCKPIQRPGKPERHDRHEIEDCIDYQNSSFAIRSDDGAALPLSIPDREAMRLENIRLVNTAGGPPRPIA